MIVGRGGRRKEEEEEMEEVIQQQRSLAETPTYSVASVIVVMVFVCLLVERSIYRCGKVNKMSWLVLLSWEMFCEKANLFLVL